MKLHLIALISLLVANFVAAEHEQEKRIIEILGYKERLHGSIQRIADYMRHSDGVQFTEEEIRFTQKEMERIVNWEGMEAGLIEYFSSSFTQKELHEMILFWESEIGQKTISAFHGANAWTVQYTNESAKKAMDYYNLAIEQKLKESNQSR